MNPPIVGRRRMVRNLHLVSHFSRLDSPIARFALGSIADCAAWLTGLVFTSLVTTQLSIGAVDWPLLFTLTAVVCVVQVVLGASFGLYLGRSRVGSFDEMRLLAKTVAGTTMVLVALTNAVSSLRMTPRFVAVSAGMAAFLVMCAVRGSFRLVVDRDRRPGGASCRRLLVFGAGDGGVQAIAAMLGDATSPFLPVALLDDDRTRCNRAIMGVRVVGSRLDIARAASRFDAEGLLIAIPSADADLIADVSARATESGLFVKVLPRVAELFGEHVAVRDIREVSERDLLGRRAVETDISSVAGYIRGRRVLITGAGGSIGSELCRQIAALDPADLCMLDHDESALHATQLSIEGRAQINLSNLILADIRDEAALLRIFQEKRPEVVFHAAALKHVPMLERYPDEAWKSNVVGTLAVLTAAASAGVQKFLNISTDKAANPATVLGYSKRIGERMTAHFDALNAGTYLSVRFGNVLGSRGSVLPTFQAQLSRGGPITVTHREATRFFMTVGEACQLTMQAGAIGRGGEVLILDMGDPVRIAGLAEFLIERTGRPIAIEYTGLRTGEKLHEVLLGESECGERPFHPLITHVPVPCLSPQSVAAIDASSPSGTLVEQLRAAATEGEVVGVVAVGAARTRWSSSTPTEMSPADIPSSRGAA